MIFLIAAGCGDEPGDSAQKSGAQPEVVSTQAEDVHAAIRDTDGELVLVNFWATWCVPCVEEFPDLMKVYREFEADGLRLLLVSGDRPSELDRVKVFLAGQGVDFKSYIKTGSDQKFINGVDPEWSGAAPATWIFDAKGNRLAFWEGKASHDGMRRNVLDAFDTLD